MFELFSFEEVITKRDGFLHSFQYKTFFIRPLHNYFLKFGIQSSHHRVQMDLRFYVPYLTRLSYL